jgi:hypothetical protein
MRSKRGVSPFQHPVDKPAQWEVFLKGHGWPERGLIEHMQADRKVKTAVMKWVKKNLHKRFTPTAVQKYLGVYKAYEHR